MSLTSLKAAFNALNISGVVQDLCLTDRVWYEEGRKAAHSHETLSGSNSLVDKTWCAFAAQRQVFFGAGRLGLQVQRAVAPFPLPSLQGGLALCSLTAPCLSASALIPRVHLLQGPLVNRALMAFGRIAAQGSLALLFACQTEFFLGRGHQTDRSLGPTSPTDPNPFYGPSWQILCQQLIASPHGTDMQSHNGFVGRILEVPLVGMADRAQQQGHRSLAALWQGMACCMRAAMLLPRLASCAVVLLYAVLCGSFGVLLYDFLWLAQQVLAHSPWPLRWLATGSHNLFAGAQQLIDGLVMAQLPGSCPQPEQLEEAENTASELNVPKLAHTQKLWEGPQALVPVASPQGVRKIKSGSALVPHQAVQRHNVALSGQPSSCSYPNKGELDLGPFGRHRRVQSEYDAPPERSLRRSSPGLARNEWAPQIRPLWPRGTLRDLFSDHSDTSFVPDSLQNFRTEGRTRAYSLTGRTSSHVRTPRSVRRPSSLVIDKTTYMRSEEG